MLPAGGRLEREGTGGDRTGPGVVPGGSEAPEAVVRVFLYVARGGRGRPRD